MNPANVYWDDWLLLAVQVVGLLALATYVWKTWQMASATRTAAETSLAAINESRDARLESLAPRIVVYFDGDRHFSAQIVIYNAGAGAAGDLTLTFDPPLASTDNKELLAFFNTPQSVVPPGYRIEQTFDAWPSYFASDLPREYTIVARYRGLENGRSYETRHHINIEGLRFRLVSAETTELSDIRRQLERLTMATEAIQRVATKSLYLELYRPAPGAPHSHAERLLALWDAADFVWQSDGFLGEQDALIDVIQSEALAAMATQLRSGIRDPRTTAFEALYTVIFRRDAHMMGNADWVKDVRTAFENFRVAIRDSQVRRPARSIAPDV